MVTVYNGSSSLNGHVMSSCPPAPPPPPRHQRCPAHNRQQRHLSTVQVTGELGRRSSPPIHALADPPCSSQHNSTSESPSPHHHHHQSPVHRSPHHAQCPQRPHPAGNQLMTSPNPLPTADKSIVSQKGTVRGVKNRVRSNIQNIKERTLNPNAKDYENIEKGRIIVYTTSVRIVRNVTERCTRTRRILQTHMVSYEERDLFMSQENQKDLSDRLNSCCPDSKSAPRRLLPQIFVDGKLLGGADTLENYNENGKLKCILSSFPKMSVTTPCEGCGGYSYLPCPQCHGSKRSLLRNHYTTEFVTLRCIGCDENGLVRCSLCNRP